MLDTAKTVCYIVVVSQIWDTKQQDRSIIRLLYIFTLCVSKF